MTQQEITEQEKKAWQQQEAEEVAKEKGTTSLFEKLPAVKFEENRITELVIDFRTRFERWNTTDMKGKDVVKMIIPCLVNGQRMNWWLNRKNPIYHELLLLGKGQETVTVKVLQTGNQAATKYILVK